MTLGDGVRPDTVRRLVQVGSPRRPAEERFWSKVSKDEPGGCWVHVGAPDGKGYGQFSVGTRETRRSYRAHRFAYELLVGPIPVGLDLDHRCRNRRCVNPAHLEPVTQSGSSHSRMS